MPKEELLEELGIPLTPVRLKCAISRPRRLKLALHKGKGTPLPEEWAGPTTSSSSIAVPVERLPGRRAAAGRDEARPRRQIVGRRLQHRRRALRDRGSLLARRRPALRGRLRPRRRALSICPRHGANFDIRTGEPLTLAGLEPVETFPVASRTGSSRCEADLMLDDRVRAVLERLEAEDAGRARAQALPASSARAQVARDDRAVPLRARRAAVRIARCSRSAARAATRRSGSRRAPATSAGVCSRSSPIRPRSRPGGANIAEAGLEEMGRARRGRRVRDAAADRRRLRPRLPRRREGGLRGALPARARQGSSRARSSSPTTCSPTRRRSAPTRRPARPTRPSRASRFRSTAASSSPPSWPDRPSLTRQEDTSSADITRRVTTRNGSRNGTCPVPGTRRVSGSLASVLVEPLQFDYRGKEVVRLDRFQYGQWRYQRVEVCPRDLRGIV